MKIEDPKSQYLFEVVSSSPAGMQLHPPIPPMRPPSPLPSLPGGTALTVSINTCHLPPAGISNLLKKPLQTPDIQKSRYFTAKASEYLIGF